MAKLAPARFLPAITAARRSGGAAQDRRNRPMPSEISDQALDFLLARAGLSLSAAQKAELKGVYPGIAAMAARVRQQRGHMTEPALTYGFAEEDLP
jgi:hypothetical protein